MAKKRDTFIQQLRAKQEALRGPAGPKDPANMSGEELDAEIQRLDEKIRTNKELAVAAGRAELAREQRSGRSELATLFSQRRQKRPWK